MKFHYVKNIFYQQISLSEVLIKNIFDGPKIFEISTEMHFVSLFRHF